MIVNETKFSEVESFRLNDQTKATKRKKLKTKSTKLFSNPTERT